VDSEIIGAGSRSFAVGEYVMAYSVKALHIAAGGIKRCFAAWESLVIGEA
jgi:hypothetical protein